MTFPPPSESAPVRIRCSDFARLFGDEFPGCCPSCHYDFEDGIDSLIFDDVFEPLSGEPELELFVCCDVMTWLDGEDSE